MKTTEIRTLIVEKAIDELSSETRRLVDLAKEATYRAYAPYSHFSVGAAIRLSNGEVVTGSNQENSAFPSGMCAERTAAFYAHSAYPDAKFEAIAIAARGTDGQFLKNPISPCGGCRQVLIEYEKLSGKPMEVVLSGSESVYIISTAKALLPLAFEDIE